MISCHPDPFQAFVNDLQIEGCEVHIYRGAKTFGQILHAGGNYGTDWWDTENIYFLAGVRPGIAVRASDHDVKRRGMFTLDFDIRKELEKRCDTPVMREEIERCAESLLEKLDKIPEWQSFRYAVLSGNGLHIHYFGEPMEVVKEDWSAGMRVLFDEVNAITSVPCDTGCGNAGRIMRMPGTWNLKDPLCKKPVTFLAWNIGAIFEPFSRIQENGRKSIAEAAIRRAVSAAEFAVKHPGGSSTVFDIINAVQIEQVILQLPLGITTVVQKKDHGLRFRDGRGVERGFFKHKIHNIIVHEGTSLFPASTGVGYNCLGLVKIVLGCTAHEAVEWFALRTSKLREALELENTAWRKEKAKKISDEYIGALVHLPMPTP